MKKFMDPEMELLKLSVADIITTSDGEGGGNADFGGPGEEQW